MAGRRSAGRHCAAIAGQAGPGYNLRFSDYGTKDTDMVVIRLTRGGAKKRPFYHIVAAHKQVRRDGQFIERLGYYNPIATANEVGLNLALERVDFWKQQGAVLSPTVARLVKEQAGKQPVAA